LLKLKIDHEEQDFDLDEEWKDEAKREKLRLDIQRARNADREVARERDAERARVQKSYQDWIKSQPYDMVQDTTHPSGWKIVPRQATTPAADADPLTIEERELLPRAEDGDAKAVLRITEIRAQRAEKRARDGALEAWKTEQSAATAAASAAERYKKAEAEAYAEIDRVLAARTKSFEGLKSSPQRVRAQAFAAAKTVAENGGSWEAVLKAARDVVFAEADEQDGRVAAMRAQLTAPVPTVPSAPVVGASPSGGPTNTEFKSIKEALASRIPGYEKHRS